MLSIKQLAIIATGALSMAAGSAAMAQAYPDKPIKLVVPWPAGGIVDIVGRVIGEKLQVSLGQTLIVENKAGAGGMIGAEGVARSAPDGYTLLLTSSALNMNTALGRKMSVDTAQAFAPVRVVAWAPSILVAYPGLNLKSVKDLVALAKSKPGELPYASAGNGSPAHFAAELFRSEAGVDVVHVPYKGAPAAMNDQIAGRVSFHFANAAVGLPQIRAGKVVALGITTDQRSPLLPDVPTMAESGFAGVNASQWLGFFAPAGTPREVVDKLAAAIGEALTDPQVRATLERSAMSIEDNITPARFSELMKSDLARWQAVARSANIKLN